MTLIPLGNDGAQPYDNSAGMMLGMHHFNNGIGSVVEEVSGMNETCPVRLSLDKIHDSESSQTVAVTHFGNAFVKLNNPRDRPPAGLFGAYRSAVLVPLAILGGGVLGAAGQPGVDVD